MRLVEQHRIDRHDARLAAACAAWQADPSRFLGHPTLPHSLDKRGRTLLIDTEQALSRSPMNRG